jgi:PKD repeat protein
MDLWVEAVAAGAGYVVKANYLKNSSTRLKRKRIGSIFFRLFSQPIPVLEFNATNTRANLPLTEIRCLQAFSNR